MSSHLSSFYATYMSFPTKKDDWLQICNGTFKRWNFPNCFGAADGKHIAITKPINSGSIFRIVLLAMVDYDYEILAVDVACRGRISDGSVFRNSCLYSAFKSNEVNLPKARALPNTTDNIEVDNLPSPEVPLVFAADDAFSLTNFCMKPYNNRNQTELQRIFGYRLFRIRRVTENTFGIWGNHFRVFSVRNNHDPVSVTHIILASLTLHNMLRKKSKEFFTLSGYGDEDGPEGEIINGRWREEQESSFITNLQPGKCNHASSSAENIRKVFAEYFYGPGQVS